MKFPAWQIVNFHCIFLNINSLEIPFARGHRRRKWGAPIFWLGGQIWSKQIKDSHSNNQPDQYLPPPPHTAGPGQNFELIVRFF